MFTKSHALELSNRCGDNIRSNAHKRNLNLLSPLFVPFSSKKRFLFLIVSPADVFLLIIFFYSSHCRL